MMTKVEYTYDNYRRITQEKQTSANNTALNKTVNYTYSGLTETRTTVTDQQETVTLVHDAKGNLLSQADSKGTTTYTYDAAGRLTGVASPGYPMAATYNEYGLCTSVTNPSSGTTTYTYNGFDELATETDAKGNTTTYTYNASGLPTSKNDGTRSISYVYNNKGQLTSEGYSGHQTVYTYNTNGLLSKEVKTIEGISLTKQYTYDSKGRLDTYTSPSGLILKYGYNTVNDLSIITDNTTNTNLWEIRVYNEFGLIAMENGVGGRQTTYTYDQAGRPLTMNNDLASFTYTYNGGGQLTKRVENFGTTGLTETFAYDASGCLTSSTLQGKTPVTMSYNSGRGITNKSDVGTYSYGANGAPLASINRVSSYNPGAQSISYNSSNLPASITQGGYTRTYTYDVNDQRDYSVLTKSNSSLPFAAGKRYYFGDFERNINTENNVVTDLDYIFADGRLVALVKTVGTTKTAYGVLTDRQGSLRALYNGSGLVQSFSYDAWGNRRNPSTGAALTTSELVAANSITSRGYTCHEHMDEFGLINMNARIYDPALGMFISVDPLAQEYYNTYPYAYCGGDPVNAVDPTGKDAVIIINGNTITIKSEIVLTGENATTDLAQLYLRDILDNWGKLDTYMHDMEIYNVVWDVNVRVAEPNETYVFNGVNNYMEVTSDVSKVRNTNFGYIRGEGWFNRTLEESNPMSHEFGHMLGLLDKAIKDKKSKKPKYNRIKGWEGNVMAEESGKGIPEQKNLDIILPKAIKYFQSVKRYADIAPWTQYYYINQFNRE